MGANNAPTINHLKDADNAIISSKAINEDGLINLTVVIADGDPSTDWPEVSAGQHKLIVTAESDDQILLPNGNIALAGNGSPRTVTLSPAADQHGSVVITFKVSDGIDQDTATLTLTVNSVNDAPSFIMGDDVTVAEDPGVKQ